MQMIEDDALTSERRACHKGVVKVTSLTEDHSRRFLQRLRSQSYSRLNMLHLPTDPHSLRQNCPLAPKQLCDHVASMVHECVSVTMLD